MSDPIGDAVGGAMEHAAADAAAGLSGKPATKHHGDRDPNCLNCGAELYGDFCHKCGQSGEGLRRPFWSLAAESLETLFSIDSRIARTLPPLLMHPGRVTRDYLDGKRMRFIPPFRLYVLASLVFFVVVPLMTGQGLAFTPKGEIELESARAEIEKSFKAGDLTEEEYESSIEVLGQVEEALEKGDISRFLALQGIDDEAAAPEGNADETGDAPAGDPTANLDVDIDLDSVLPREAADAIREAAQNGDPDVTRLARAVQEPDELAKNTMRWVPRLMFVMLPAYASLLALVYLWRSQFLFFDHLIVSLHFHTALFFTMALTSLLAPFIGLGWVVVAMIVYSNWYLYRLNRVVYGRSGFTSVLRVLTLDTIYFGMLMTGLLIAVILGAMNL